MNTAELLCLKARWVKTPLLPRRASFLSDGCLVGSLVGNHTANKFPKGDSCETCKLKFVMWTLHQCAM